MIEKIKALMERADKNLQSSKLLLYCYGSYRAGNGLNIAKLKAELG